MVARLSDELAARPRHWTSTTRVCLREKLSPSDEELDVLFRDFRHRYLAERTLDEEAKKQFSTRMSWLKVSSREWITAKALHAKYGGRVAVSSFGGCTSIEGRRGVTGLCQRRRHQVSSSGTRASVLAEGQRRPRSGRNNPARSSQGVLRCHPLGGRIPSDRGRKVCVATLSRTFFPFPDFFPFNPCSSVASSSGSCQRTIEFRTSKFSHGITLKSHGNEREARGVQNLQPRRAASMAAMSIFFICHHRLERALGGCGIGIGDRFRQSQRRNLP